MSDLLVIFFNGIRNVKENVSSGVKLKETRFDCLDKKTL